MTSAGGRVAFCCETALIAGVAIFGIVMLARMQFAPHSVYKTAVVIFPPWTNDGRVIGTAAAAGASILRLGRFSFIAVVHPNNAHYAGRVIAEGAWLVLDAEGFGGCLTGDGARS